MIPCLHFGLRHVSGRFPIEPKLASWVESGYKSPQSPGPRQRGRRRDGLSRRRRGRFRSTAPYPAATNSRGVSKPRARRDNGLTLGLFVPSLASILLAGSPAFTAYVSLVVGPVCRKAGTAAQGRHHQPLTAPLPQPASRSLAVGGSR